MPHYAHTVEITMRAQLCSTMRAQWRKVKHYAQACPLIVSSNNMLSPPRDRLQHKNMPPERPSRQKSRVATSFFGHFCGFVLDGPLVWLIWLEGHLCRISHGLIGSQALLPYFGHSTRVRSLIIFNSSPKVLAWRGSRNTSKIFDYSSKRSKLLGFLAFILKSHWPLDVCKHFCFFHSAFYSQDNLVLDCILWQFVPPNIAFNTVHGVCDNQQPHQRNQDKIIPVSTIWPIKNYLKDKS